MCEKIFDFFISITSSPGKLAARRIFQLPKNFAGTLFCSPHFLFNFTKFVIEIIYNVPIKYKLILRETVERETVFILDSVRVGRPLNILRENPRYTL